jgi:uncharacterized protein YjbJ (UPF0337 family)
VSTPAPPRPSLGATNVISGKEPIMGLDDKIKNAAQDIVGKAKEAIGNATDNDKLAAEGKADQVKADAKKAGENVKDAFNK